MDLPGIHDAADEASGRGQRLYLRLSATRLFVLLSAAVGGALMGVLDGLSLLGWLVLLCFVVAAASEVFLIALQPERDWYAGRAIAESTKTLAWRYAVGAKPFTLDMSGLQAERLLSDRISEVVQKGRDRLDLGAKPAVVTDSMRKLRNSEFSERRSSYVSGRTRDQRDWYSKNARENAARAKFGRFIMLGGEFLAIVAAFFAIQSYQLVDFAGIIAALTASAAAWIAIKQYSQLASAYRVAALELAIQEGVLASLGEAEWAQAVADAEEAISREHTMWLASRGAEKF